MTFKIPSNFPEKVFFLYQQFRQELINGTLKRVSLTSGQEAIFFDCIKIFVCPITGHLLIQQKHDDNTWTALNRMISSNFSFSLFSSSFTFINEALILSFYAYAKKHGENITKYSESQQSTINYWLDKVLLGGSKKQKSTYQRWTAKAIWSIVNKEYSCIANNYFSKRFTNTDYNYVVDNFNLLKQLKCENPNLTPLIGIYIKQILQHKYAYDGNGYFKDFKGGHIKIDENVVHLIKRFLCDDLVKSNHKIIDSEMFNITRTGNHTCCLRDVGWRWISKQSLPIIRQYIRHNPYDNRLVNFLGENNINVSYTIFKKLALILESNSSLLILNNDDGEKSLGRFIRISVKESQIHKKNGTLKNFCSMDFHLCWSWFSRSRQDPDDVIRLNRRKNLQNVSRNESWESLMRKQRQWHDEIRNNKEVLVNASWKSLLEESKFDAIKINALTTTKDLQLEGMEMSHCVISYASSCVSGHSRIFKAVNSSERATIEITSDITKKRWKVSQVRGFNNAKVSTKMEKAGVYVSGLYNKLANEQKG